MKNHQNNFAYIDGANLHEGIKELGWKLDYKRFRVWLLEKYGVSRAYIFIGLIPKFKDLYMYLQNSGFTLVFKEVIYDGSGKPKGNCDTDLVIRAMVDAYENQYDAAIIVASDGDYSPLVTFLQTKNKFKTVISPNMPRKCSILLKRTGAPIVYIKDQQFVLELKKRQG